MKMRMPEIQLVVIRELVKRQSKNDHFLIFYWKNFCNEHGLLRFILSQTDF